LRVDSAAQTGLRAAGRFARYADHGESLVDGGQQAVGLGAAGDPTD
jgi:hypothetical protein